MDPLKYKCHRQYLADFIEKNEASRNDFLIRLDGKITKGALSHFLKTNSQGQFARAYKFKLNTWIDILSHIKLNSKEFDYLVMLKLNEDILLEYGEGSKPLKSINRISRTITKDRQLEQSLSVALAALPQRRKNKVYLTVFRELDYLLSSKGRIGAGKKLRDLRDYFGHIVGAKSGSRNGQI